jgi:hypothetical protein
VIAWGKSMSAAGSVASIRRLGLLGVGVTAAAITITGCATNPTTPSSAGVGNSLPSSSSSFVAATPPESSTEMRCEKAFPGQRVLGWETTTVGAVRAYRYGPPGRQPPLASAFAGISDAQDAAWCVVLISPTSSSLWAVVAGQQPSRALTETGPGQDTYLGQLAGPPQPP